MNRNKVNKVLKISLIIFLIIQPIFDLKIFYNSISTLIRVTVIFLLFVSVFILDNNKKKYLIFPYFALIIAYFIFHHLNAKLNFYSVVPGNFNYSLIKEFAYFVKMLSPFLLIYTLLNLNIKFDKIKLIIYFICISVSLIIIISNLFLFSYSSYNDMPIKANFLSWFTNTGTGYSYDELLSKGLFKFANQISALLSMSLPLIIYFTIKKKKSIDIIALSLTILAMLIVGTRTAILSIPIIFTYVIFTFIVFYFIDKKKFIDKKSLSIFSIIFSLYIIIVVVHPIYNRYQLHRDIVETSSSINIDNINKSIFSDNESSESNNININNQDNIISEDIMAENNNYTANAGEIINFISENYKTFRIHDQFILDSYPYQYDPDFWYDIFKKPVNLRVDYRYLETAMVKRVVQINNNKLDILLGITNTRVQNIFNIEKDFVVQYYSLGIIGLVLFIFPYVGLLLYYIYLCVKHKDLYFNQINIISFITIIFLLCISYYSGNLLNSLSFTIYFSILFRLLYLKEDNC